MREFVSAHLETKVRHLALMQKLVPPVERSRLLTLWQAAGWLLGPLPAAGSMEAAFATSAAVEEYVEDHYVRQITRVGTESGIDCTALHLNRLLLLL